MDRRSERSTCFTIGLGPLCIRCTEYLVDYSDIEVKGVISADPAVIEWASRRGLDALRIQNKVNYSASKAPIDAFLTRSRFDYLFSIINAMFLPEEIIRLPRRCAINFHDSELPKYAGIDATSWAIMRGETEHAVTWHLMSPTIDEGDILKQTRVPIDEHETAFTLNEKCVKAGFASFKDLLADIRLERTQRKKQRPAMRSYYSRSKPHLPEMSIWTHGIVAWRRPAEDIEALTRALDYGPSRNSLGTAKLAIGGDFYILPSVAVCNAKSSREPGTVVRNGGQSLRIATTSRDVLVDSLLTIEGRPTSIADLSTKHGVECNARLDEVPADLLSRIKQLDKNIMWKEAYWAGAIRSYPAVKTAHLDGVPIRAVGEPSVRVDVPLTEGAREALRKLVADKCLERRTLLFGCFSSYLALASRAPTVPIWYSDDEYRGEVAGMTKLFSPFALCGASFDDGCDIVGHCDRTEEQLLGVKKQGHFLFDILYRYPDLRAGRKLDELREFGFSFHDGDGRPDDGPAGGDCFDLALEVIERGEDFSLSISSAGNEVENLVRIAERFATHVAAIATHSAVPFRSNRVLSRRA